MPDKHILLHIDARGIAIVTLNRPEKHNAFDDKIIAELTSTFEQIATNDQVKVMILRANGRNFCAGADMNWMQRMATYSYEENIKDANALCTMFHTLNFLPVPVIARVQGAAMGGGSGLVCCCDIAIASTNAVFAFSEVKLGIIPAALSPYAIHTIGAHAARRYFLTAERFDAEQARALGMVSEVTEEELLDDRIDELVDTILQNGPQAVNAAKQLIFEIEGQDITDNLIEISSKHIAEIRATAEGREGLTAFLEKRKPAWQQE